MLRCAKPERAEPAPAVHTADADALTGSTATSVRSTAVLFLQRASGSEGASAITVSFVTSPGEAG